MKIEVATLKYFATPIIRHNISIRIFLLLKCHDMLKMLKYLMKEISIASVTTIKRHGLFWNTELLPIFIDITLPINFQ